MVGCVLDPGLPADRVGGVLRFWQIALLLAFLSFMWNYGGIRLT